MDAKPIAMSVEQFRGFLKVFTEDQPMVITDGVKLHVHVHVGADAVVDPRYLRTPSGRQVKGGDDSEGLSVSLAGDGVDVNDENIEWFDGITGSFGGAHPSESVDRQVVEGRDGSTTTTEEENRTE